MSASEHVEWFIRTFSERQEELQRWFGPTVPEGNVFELKACRPTIPGACALVFAPDAEANPPRTAWLITTLGLSHPLDATRAPLVDGLDRPLEFVIGMPTNQPLGLRMVSALMQSALTDPSAMRAGQTIELASSLCDDDQRMTHVVLWPLSLKPKIVTTTGVANLLVATAITSAETMFARRTSAAHLLTLLVDDDVGQLTVMGRLCALRDSARAERVAALAQVDVEALLCTQLSRCWSGSSAL